MGKWALVFETAPPLDSEVVFLASTLILFLLGTKLRELLPESSNLVTQALKKVADRFEGKGLFCLMGSI